MTVDDAIRLVEFTLLQQQWEFDFDDNDNPEVEGLRAAMEQWPFWDSPAAREGAHMGDCTDVACPCTRCHADARHAQAMRIVGAFLGAEK